MVLTKSFVAIDSSVEDRSYSLDILLFDSSTKDRCTAESNVSTVLYEQAGHLRITSSVIERHIAFDLAVLQSNLQDERYVKNLLDLWQWSTGHEQLDGLRACSP